MAAITRASVAEMVHESLDELGNDFSPVESAGRSEGDYTFPIDRTLLDLDYADISEADTSAKIRAVITGTTYHALERLFRKLINTPTAQQGAGASGMHLSINMETNIRSLRLHLKDAKDSYLEALQAIGVSLTLDPDAAPDLYVMVDADVDSTAMLIDETVGVPWFKEGYHAGW